jgi:hypothetical protein
LKITMCRRHFYCVSEDMPLFENGFSDGIPSDE